MSTYWKVVRRAQFVWDYFRRWATRKRRRDLGSRVYIRYVEEVILAAGLGAAFYYFFAYLTSLFCFGAYYCFAAFVSSFFTYFGVYWAF